MAIIAIGMYAYREYQDTGDTTRFEPKHFTAPQQLHDEYVRVYRIVDGDTLKIAHQGKEESLRLIGINTPEIANARKGTSNQPGALEASHWLEDFLAPDPQIRLEFDVERRDKYQRLLAYAWVKRKGQELMLNEELVRHGYAKPKYYAPNGKYRERLEAAVPD